MALKLSENLGINEHAINLINGNQPLYRYIYTLSPIELEMLKIYIETHLKTGFIPLFKSPSRAPIFVDKKSDGNLCLCINYRGLNNLTIKNRDPLPLIEESLNWLGQAKKFTQLDFTSVY